MDIGVKNFMAVKIFIDQGHNPSGFNAGAEGFGYREQDINYQVGTYLYNLLQSDPRFEARVSRTTPTQQLGTSNATSLQARVNLANEWGADYFISIHCNASENPQANGTEAYVYNLNSDVARLASDIVDSIVSNLETRNLGVKENRSLYVLRRTTMPAVLVELAFITNESDVNKLVNNQYEFAYAIYQGILDYFNYKPL